MEKDIVCLFCFSWRMYLHSFIVKHILKLKIEKSRIYTIHIMM